MRENLRDVRLRVGRNVQRLRLLRGLSQERLAELVGNTGKHISLVERGEVNVGLDILSQIARALSADVQDLFIGPRGGRRSDSPFFIITQRQLDQIDQALRNVRAARPKRSLPEKK
jgi:transcriptional regulator with XRE-family HTH domain